jgi:N-acetyl sugar amidotransferase
MDERRVCARCVMDTSATDIVFDERGICNYCRAFEAKLQRARAEEAAAPTRREQFLATVKAGGKGHDYDCVVGVSGGVDSSYVLYLMVKRGLRPLAVHLDNGWNSELATHNIANLVSRLHVDLYTHVIDWEENRDLQRSFFAANVVDIELLMDNAMYALNYQQASARGIRWILAGTNMATEGMAMPPGWIHYKFDKRNIRAIQQRFGSSPIKTHPLISTLDFVWYEYVRRIQWVSVLDYFAYDKFAALDILQRECDYKPYPYKHYESVFTRFYQGYILPRKFGYDKRRGHLAALVVTGQMTRDAALQMLEQSPYPDPALEQQDRAFVMKKLGFSEQEFDAYMRAPAVPHAVYGSEEPLYRTFLKINSVLKSARGSQNGR